MKDRSVARVAAKPYWTGMKRNALLLATAACASLCACSPKPQATPVAEAAPAPAPPPARPMKMVCRNSQDGRKVACGTPGAVMVGMTPE